MGASKVSFWPWSPGVFSFPMGSCSSLVFRGILSSTACPAGGIGSRDVSKVSFWPWFPGVSPFYMDSCSSLDFGDFLSTTACSLGGIGSEGVSRIFGLWSPSVFPPSMSCGGGWIFLPSAPYLFVSVFDWSHEEEDSGISVFTVRVVTLLVVLILSEALISLTSVASLKISVNRATHILFIFQFLVSVSLIHRWIVDFISGSASAKSSSSSWPDYLIFDWFCCCRFRGDLIVASSSYCSAEALEEVGCCSLEGNWGCCWYPTSCFWLWLVWSKLTWFLLSWEYPLCLLSWRGWRYFPGLIFHRSLCRFLVVWHVLVWLLSCSCRSHIVILMKWSQRSGLLVIGLQLLALLVWRRGGGRSGCRSLKYGDWYQGVWG